MSTQFALDLRHARRKSGFTQHDIAHLSQTPQSSIAALEKGSWLPTLEQYCLFSLIYGRSFESLFADAMEASKQTLRGNISALSASKSGFCLTRNRDTSIKKLEGRLAAQTPSHDSV